MVIDDSRPALSVDAEFGYKMMIYDTAFRHYHTRDKKNLTAISGLIKAKGLKKEPPKQLSFEKSIHCWGAAPLTAKYAALFHSDAFFLD